MKRTETENFEHDQNATDQTANVVTFEPLEGALPQQNLAEFIRLARDDLTVFGADLDWDSWRWDGVGMFLKHGCRGRPKSPEGWHMDPLFADFAKAYIRYSHAQNPTSGKSLHFAALRAIEHALKIENAVADPTKICLDTLDNAAQALREHLEQGGAYGAGQHLVSIARFLASHGITHNDVGSWDNPISCPCKVQVAFGAEGEAHRRAHMPDMEALNAIGTVFARGFDLTDNATHPDVYVTSVVAMLMAQAGRVGEVHELTVDLEFEQRDLKGDVQYGFRYRSYKAAKGTRIKWVPAVWTPFAREAVRRIREITERPRAFARYVELQLEAKKKDPRIPMPFYRHSGCPDVADDQPLSAEQAAAALGFTGRTEHGSRGFLRGRGLTSKRGAYTLNSLWQHTLGRLPPSFPYVTGAKNKRLKYSESLFCMHSSQLKHGISPDPVSIWSPSLNTLGPLLSPSDSRNARDFFERNRVTGKDGKVLRLKSHQIRHLLNTLGHEGTGDTFLDNETINYWSGRDQAWQGVTYNHVPPEEIARRAGEVLKKTTTGPGVIELRVPPPDVAEPPSHWSVTHPAPKSCADIEIHHRSAVMMTLWGGCEHDWLLEPCQFHQDCINCKEHFCIKGFGKDDLERIERLRQLLSKVIHQQTLAKACQEAGELGAGSYHSYQTSYRERIEQLIALLERPDVPEGAKIRLTDASANSHLHRVLREMALSKLIEIPEKKDVIEALLLAYRENRALPLDETMMPTLGGTNA